MVSGTGLKSTGVCDNGWIRVDYNGQTCYASGELCDSIRSWQEMLQQKQIPLGRGNS
ncbi:MAG: hypothetical protein ACLUTA_13115 [Blautia wexlerae]